MYSLSSTLYKTKKLHRINQCKYNVTLFNLRYKIYKISIKKKKLQIKLFSELKLNLL